MLLMAFFQWWYGHGWLEAVADAKRHLEALAGSFSLGILLRTLFAPWKQMDAYGGKGLQSQVDKFVSRFVGFGVRSVTLVTAIVSLAFMAIVQFAWILLWPCLPPLIFLLVGYGLGLLG
jgi:hypothetical protein